jgi:hypothetical protein
MGWQIILVDAGNKLRNGGTTMLCESVDAEAEAWSRANTHDSIVSNREDKIINVVCVKNR